MNYTDLITFVAQLKNKRSHISRIIAVFLLWVFAIALTPWSSIHHHDDEVVEHCAENAKMCMHKVHIGTAQHNCLVCSAHFEKDLHINAVKYKVNLESKGVIKNFSLISASYVSLISTSLRGPPAA